MLDCNEERSALGLFGWAGQGGTEYDRINRDGPFGTQRRTSPDLPALGAPQNELVVNGGIFVKPDKVSDCHRETGCLRLAERIDIQLVLESRDDDRKTQRVQPALQQAKIIEQRS